jgi:hypothetical protein
MTRLKFEYDFSYEAATGQPWRDVVEGLIHEAAEVAVERLRAVAPSVTGTLAGSHVAVPGKESALLRNTAGYAEFVLPKGSRGRWRWWMGREMRNAFEDVSIRRFGDVEDAVLASIGPVPRAGERRQALIARQAARKAAVQSGSSRIAVPVRAPRSSARATSTARV